MEVVVISWGDIRKVEAFVQPVNHLKQAGRVSVRVHWRERERRSHG